MGAVCNGIVARVSSAEIVQDIISVNVCIVQVFYQVCRTNFGVMSIEMIF